MKRVGIIGTRDPSEAQVAYINDFLEKLDPEKVEIISGCCAGVDAIALKLAKEKGFKTLGAVPWKKYNPEIQALCTEIIHDKNTDEETKKAAMDSVFKYHPNPHACSQGAKLLHARNYIIVYKDDAVLACPKNLSGGTMQGVRICVDLGINLIVVKDDGTIATPEEYK